MVRFPLASHQNARPINPIHLFAAEAYRTCRRGCEVVGWRIAATVPETSVLSRCDGRKAKTDAKDNDGQAA